MKLVVFSRWRGERAGGEVLHRVELNYTWGRFHGVAPTWQNERGSLISDIRTVLSWLPARERWRWVLLVPIVGLAALIEAAGALAVFGLLRLVVDPEQVRTAPVVSAIWRAWPNDDTRRIVALLALGSASSTSRAPCFCRGRTGSSRAWSTARPQRRRSACWPGTSPPIICFTSGAARRRSSSR